MIPVPSFRCAAILNDGLSPSVKIPVPSFRCDKIMCVRMSLSFETPRSLISLRYIRDDSNCVGWVCIAAAFGRSDAVILKINNAIANDGKG